MRHFFRKQTKPSGEPLAVVKQVSQEDREYFRHIRALLSQQQFIVQAMEKAFIGVVQEKYGVDLEHENWTLDMEKGELVRGSSE